MSDIIYNYHKICQDVKNLDKKIRFTGIINERGRLVASEIKKESHFVSAKDDEILFMELALRVRMRRDFEDRLGKVRYSMTIREEMLELPLKILKMINNQEKSQMKILKKQKVRKINQHGNELPDLIQKIILEQKKPLEDQHSENHEEYKMNLVVFI